MSAQISDPTFNATADQAVPAETTPVAAPFVAAPAATVVGPNDPPWMGMPIAEIPADLTNRILHRFAVKLTKGHSVDESARLTCLPVEDAMTLVETHSERWQISLNVIQQLTRISDDGKAREQLRSLLEHENANVSLRAAIRMNMSADVLRHEELKKYEKGCNSSFGTG